VGEAQEEPNLSLDGEEMAIALDVIDCSYRP